MTDRDALARRLTSRAVYERIDDPDDPADEEFAQVLDAAAAALRLPAQAEVEKLADDLCRLQSHIQGSPAYQFVIDAETMLRRLSSLPPAAGEIKPRNLDGTNWKHRCCQIADAARQEGFDYALSLQTASPAVGEWRPIASMVFSPEGTSDRYLLCDNYGTVVIGSWLRGRWYSEKAGYCPLGAEFVWIMPLPVKPS